MASASDSASDSYDATDHRYRLQDAARRLLPDHRIGVCLRQIPRLGGDVDVYYNADRKTAHFGNLMHCGNAWVCPHCAAKKGEERRKLLQRVVEAAAAQGVIAVLTTYTLSHQRRDSLSESWLKMNEALRFVRSGRAYQNLKEQYGIVGSATGREVTHGVNGWHPHVHELLFIRADALTGGAHEELEQALARRWLAALERFGASASMEHGFSLRMDATPEYVAKYGKEDLRAREKRESGGWTVEHEVTKSASKVARSKAGRTPFQLLRDYSDGDRRAGALFVEYAGAMRGKTQFKFSKGLLELFDIDPDAAPDLEVDADSSTELLTQITPSRWRAVCGMNKRYMVLLAASAGDEELVQAYIDEVVKEYDRKIELRLRHRNTVLRTLRRNIIQSGESCPQASPESGIEGRTRTGSADRAAASAG